MYAISEPTHSTIKSGGIMKGVYCQFRSLGNVLRSMEEFV